jgi:hypothetical protein
VRFSFDSLLLRFELELGFPALLPKKYDILPRKETVRVKESLIVRIAEKIGREQTE